jgi:Zn-dependent protease with chaperone function
VSGLTPWRRAAGLIAVAVVVAACASAPPRPPTRVREATPAEQKGLARLLGVLVVRSGGTNTAACPIGLGILVTPVISAGVGPATRCPASFDLMVTEGALRLDALQLQAMLAHEIGHVRLGHLARSRERAAARDSTSSALGVAGAVANAIPLVGPLVASSLMVAQVVAPVGVELGVQAFSRRDETEADEFAARLMRQVAGPPGCLALAALFERLDAEGSTSGGWLSSHPSARARADATRAACELPAPPG